MPKLMICAPKCGQSTPKVRAICATSSSAANNANMIKAFICEPAVPRPLPHQEQPIEDDRLSERDRQNGLNQNLRGRTGIAAHRSGCRCADHADAYGCSSRG